MVCRVLKTFSSSKFGSSESFLIRLLKTTLFTHVPPTHIDATVLKKEFSTNVFWTFFRIPDKCFIFVHVWATTAPSQLLRGREILTYLQVSELLKYDKKGILEPIKHRIHNVITTMNYSAGSYGRKYPVTVKGQISSDI